MTRDHMADSLGVELDPKRWVTLTIVIIAAMISSLDNTVLNVAIPSILRDFHTDLPSVQWVVSGYALTFATLLIIGGRLGDVYGHRRCFMVGASLFGLGSLIASFATSVPMLLAGEAVIEGIGAALMLPATTAILSTTFQGRERATAFAAWGAAVGSAAAFGPAVGGFLTTYYSWRWALRINVVVAPAAVIGALLFVHRDGRPERRPRLDVPGALLIGGGDVPLGLRTERGQHLRLADPEGAVHRQWTGVVARIEDRVDRRGRLRSRRGHLDRVLLRRAFQGANRSQPSVRVRPAPAPGIPLRLAHEHRGGHGQPRPHLRPTRRPAGRRTSVGRPDRALAHPLWPVHHRRAHSWAEASPATGLPTSSSASDWPSRRLAWWPWPWPYPRGSPWSA